MTMLNNTSSDSMIPAAPRRSPGLLTTRLARWFNDWVNAVIAHRERQAQLYTLRTLSDRDLHDLGINRSQIGEGLAQAAAERSRCQQSRKITIS
jgi:uncharacterized protein YjiS (DUF1127 family)